MGKSPNTSGKKFMLWPEEVKLIAEKMFYKGVCSREIAEEISKLVGRNASQTLVNTWIISRGWAEKRTAMIEKASNIIESNAEHSIINRIEQHKNVYREMIDKGVEGLRDDTLIIDKITDAAGLIDIGVKGERQAITGLVSFKFIQKIMKILAEEITDDEVKGRIARRLHDEASEILSVRNSNSTM